MKFVKGHVGELPHIEVNFQTVALNPRLVSRRPPSRPPESDIDRFGYVTTMYRKVRHAKKTGFGFRKNRLNACASVEKSPSTVI